MLKFEAVTTYYTENQSTEPADCMGLSTVYALPCTWLQLLANRHSNSSSQAEVLCTKLISNVSPRREVACPRLLSFDMLVLAISLGLPFSLYYWWIYQGCLLWTVYYSLYSELPTKTPQSEHITSYLESNALSLYYDFQCLLFSSCAEKRMNTHTHTHTMMTTVCLWGPTHQGINIAQILTSVPCHQSSRSKTYTEVNMTVIYLL